MDTIRIPSKALPSAAGGVSSTSEFVFADSTGAAIVLPLPSAGELAGATAKRFSIFKIYAGGRITGGTTTNFTAQLQYGTSATPGSNTDLESGAAVACNSFGNLMWVIDATVIINEAKLSGYACHLIHGSTTTFTAPAKFDNNATVDPDGNGTLGFVVTGTFSASDAANVAYLDVFSLVMVG